MLKKLLSKLGYIPKTELEILIYANEKLNNDNIKLKNNLKISNKVDKNKRMKIDSLKKQLEYCTDMLEEQVVENSSLKTTINNLQQKNHRLEKSLKETKRKEAVLLRKQGKFKEEINYLNQKIKLIESYNYAVISKLENLCFGSILPKVMKQTDLSKYLHPLKPMKVLWSEQNNSIKVEAVEAEEINEKIP